MKKIDLYLCGDEMEEQIYLPKHFEYFFDMRAMFAVLAVLAAMMLLGVPP